MNHVPVKLLQQIRWALVVYNGVLLAAFAGYTMILGRTDAFQGFGVIIVGLGLLQAIYEICDSTVLFKDSYWPKAWLSLAFALIQTFIIVQATGTYSSPFIVGVAVLIFIAEAISPFVGVALVTGATINLLMTMSGVLARPGSIEDNVVFIVVGALATATGFWFWRKRYLSRPSSVDDLSASLSTEQAKSDIILGAIEDGVVLLDDQGVIRVFNAGAATITGWPEAEALGLDYKLVLRLITDKNEPYTDDQDPFKRIQNDHKTVRDNEASLVTKSGKHLAITISASPLISKDGSVIGAVGVFRDVNEERSQEKRSADFVSTASHEMRTPVAAIEGYLALALNDRVSTIDSKAREYLEKAHDSTQHLGKLFQDLLTSTRAEDGRLSNHPVVIEMSSYIEKLAEDLRFSAEKKGLHMEYVMGAHDQSINATGGEAGGKKVIKPLYYIFADPERIREVITNLFDNAVKYTESGTVSLGLTGNTEVVQVSVNDTGPGIPAEDVPHLFQKFYRVDSSATRTIGGTGLGLFICRKIIELYNGRIWVESTVGKGSTFYINVPRITAQKASELQAAETATKPASTPISTTGTS